MKTVWLEKSKRFVERKHEEAIVLAIAYDRPIAQLLKGYWNAQFKPS